MQLQINYIALMSIQIPGLNTYFIIICQLKITNF